MVGGDFSYFFLYRDGDEPREQPRGLLRREFRDGFVIAEEAFNTQRGWFQTDYYLREEILGDREYFFVPVDEGGAQAFIARRLSQKAGDQRD